MLLPDARLAQFAHPASPDFLFNYNDEVKRQADRGTRTHKNKEWSAGGFHFHSVKSEI